MSQRHFTPALFRFLRELAAENTRDWFNANKDRYIRDLKEPSLNFIVDFGLPLQKISPHFRADPRPVGGSLFRIYRDVRFSKDKSPYKTHAGLHFRHEAGKTAYTPGFYLHLEPGQSFVGVGIWRPDNPTLKMIRDAIVADPAAWKKAIGGKTFTRRYRVTGDSLKRPPKGYDPDHPLIEILKLKDFTALAPITQKEITAAGFIDEFADLCQAGGPLVRFICRALGQAY
ncbi:MAG: DUF2461 domain-containing protein [Gemmatimonadales bacterium]|nr:DUF2461 domain-containing protein [Gemmatimonadales bacterium]